jgi:hypothetical protein
MKKTIVCLSIMFLVAASFSCYSQKQTFDLQQLLKEKKLITNNRNVIPITDGDKKGISLRGVVWLKDVNFSTGTIEVDLRGKDVFQRSFIGIAFHGVDTTTCDVVYFRPFNFRAEDPVRRIHSVQYVSEPDFPWHKLRESKPGVYEKGIEPAPSPREWLHARIVVGEKEINVYVNHASKPSLTVTKLNNRKDGLIGFWNGGLEGDFANLTLTK